jgi:hypothetical protein
MIEVSDVRSEIQIPSAFIPDNDIERIIAEQEVQDFWLVCARAIELVLAKYRGRVAAKVGSVYEKYDPKELRAQIRTYRARSGNTQVPTVNEPDSFFTRKGL